jgi:hypothetical protein
MDAFVAKASSQLWCLEIMHSYLQHKFSIFYVPKVSEMLCNTPEHHFGSNGVEWMLRYFGTLKQCIQDRNTSIHLITC